MSEIVNKVAASGLITIDLETYFPPFAVKTLDIAEGLYEGLLLREKDFREFVKNHDWSHYRDTILAVHCSADAIVPVWSYMLIATSAAPFVKQLTFGTATQALSEWYKKAIEGISLEVFHDARVVVKGCGDKPVPDSAYVYLAQHLQPVVKSMMYGEPCSTVPLYKKK